MTTYQERVSYTGSSSTSTLGGQIRLNEGDGTLTVRDPSTSQIVSLVDRSGFKVFDILGREMTRLDILGLTTIEPATGDFKNRVGITESDGRTIISTAKPGIDLRDLGV